MISPRAKGKTTLIVDHSKTQDLTPIAPIGVGV
jgi:hypothetical protein